MLTPRRDGRVPEGPEKENGRKLEREEPVILPLRQHSAFEGVSGFSGYQDDGNSTRSHQRPGDGPLSGPLLPIIFLALA
jgi:hypothetical protein